MGRARSDALAHLQGPFFGALCRSSAQHPFPSDKLKIRVYELLEKPHSSRAALVWLLDRTVLAACSMRRDESYSTQKIRRQDPAIFGRLASLDLGLASLEDSHFPFGQGLAKKSMSTPGLRRSIRVGRLEQHRTQSSDVLHLHPISLKHAINPKAARPSSRTPQPPNSQPAPEERFYADCILVILCAPAGRFAAS